MTWTRFEAIVSFIGGILGIVTFVWQFGPAIRERWGWPAGRDAETPAPALPGGQAAPAPAEDHKAALVKGVACALLAALLWSVGHVSFRTPAARAASPLLLSALVCLTGGTALFLITWLLRRRVRQTYGLIKLGWNLVGPLGLILLAANAAEFIGYLYAMHFSSAGQTMAIWKSNVLWLLLMLALFRQRLPAKASVAAVFCVLMGIYTILGPDIRSAGGTDPIVGAGFALGGGFLFAIYSFTLFKVYLRFPDAFDLLDFFEPVIPVGRLVWGERDCAA